MRFKDLDTTKFEYFCSRVAAGIGLLILAGLSLYSLRYTQEFIANNTETLVEARDPLFLSSACDGLRRHFPFLCGPDTPS